MVGNTASSNLSTFSVFWFTCFWVSESLSSNLETDFFNSTVAELLSVFTITKIGERGAGVYCGGSYKGGSYEKPPIVFEP